MSQLKFPFVEFVFLYIYGVKVVGRRRVVRDLVKGMLAQVNTREHGQKAYQIATFFSVSGSVCSSARRVIEVAHC